VTGERARRWSASTQRRQRFPSWPRPIHPWAGLRLMEREGRPSLQAGPCDLNFSLRGVGPEHGRRLSLCRGPATFHCGCVTTGVVKRRAARRPR
jgi:hypothetical protein